MITPERIGTQLVGPFGAVIQETQDFHLVSIARAEPGFRSRDHGIEPDEILRANRGQPEAKR